MKLAFTFFIAIVTWVSQDISGVREAYIKAAKSQKNSDDFFTMVSTASKENKVLWAYKGAAITLKAKFAKDRKEKKELFVEGVKLIESAIKTEPNNLEIRLIRLSIQENTPKILNYKKNITEDKRFIVAQFAKQNQSLKEYVQSFVSQSSVFTAEEKQTILN